MFFRKKKSGSRRLKREVLPQLLIILGFIGATLTQEVINILHAQALTWGTRGYGIYSVWVIAVWLGLLVFIMKVIENVYMEFKLSSSNPKGDVVPRGAVGVVMMSFDINALSEDTVTIKRLTIAHIGDSLEDIDCVYLTISGARVSAPTAFGPNGKSTLHFIRPIPIEAGGKITVDVVVDFARGASAGGQHSLLIESDDSLVTNANTTIGSFPAKGENFTVGAVTCGLISVRYTEFSGSGVIGRFLLSSDLVEDQTLYAITLKKSGNLDNDKIQNIHLTDSEGKRVTNIAAHIVQNYVTLIFDPPITILKGSNTTLEICADINSPGTIEMCLEETSDIFCVGSLYGYGNAGQLYGSSVRIEG